MTKAQAALYWRLWGRVARKWGFRSGSPVPTVPNLDDFPRRVIEAATIMAGPELPSPDHYRHACHLVATGQHLSSKGLTGTTFDQVVALYQVLVDPNDVEARARLANPEIAVRRRLVYLAKKTAPEEYIDTICRRKFGARYQSPWWEDLALPDLRDLVTTLSHAKRRKEQEA